MNKSYGYLCNIFKKWSSKYDADTINRFGFTNLENIFEWAYNNFDNEKDVYNFLTWVLTNNIKNADYETLKTIYGAFDEDDKFPLDYFLN